MAVKEEYAISPPPTVLETEEKEDDEVFEEQAPPRRNILYRSFQKLRRKKKKRRSFHDISTAKTDAADGNGQLPGEKNYDTPGTPVVKPIDRNIHLAGMTEGHSHGGLRKGSAPPAMITAYSSKTTAGKRSASDADRTKPLKENGGNMKRPFSAFFSRKNTEPELPKTPKKPDHFLDVKLKKAPVEEKLVPKTTERYKLFEGVYQVSLEVQELEDGLKLKPVVTWSHPPLGTTKCKYISATEKAVPDFAFPDLDLLESRKKARPVTETYAFVQTDMTAARTIGYCRRFKYAERARTTTETEGSTTVEVNKKLTNIQKSLRNLKVWCIVTKLHCFDTFSAIFDEVHKVRGEINQNADSEVFSFLKSIGASAAPLPGHCLPISYVSQLVDSNKMGSYEVKRPGPEDRITLLQHACLLGQLRRNSLITIMLALFTESKVLFVDKTLSSLTSTLHALTSLLYPLTWVCIYIPMLSKGIRKDVRDLVQSPSPYIIGILKSDYPRVRTNELQDTEVLVVDLTTKKLTDLRREQDRVLPISDATKKALKVKLRDVKKKKDQAKHSEVWQNFLKPFLNHIDNLCGEAETKDGVRQIPMESYLAKVTEQGDQVFAEKLLSTQMSQLYLQKNKIRMLRQ